MSSSSRKGDQNRYGLETPKVSRILSTTTMTKDDAFDMIARFLNCEKDDYMEAGVSNTDENLAVSASAWNGLRRVCNSLLPSQEFNSVGGGGKKRKAVSAWWGDDDIEDGTFLSNTPRQNTNIRTVPAVAAGAAAGHGGPSFSSSDAIPKVTIKDESSEGMKKQLDKASKKEKKQAKKEAKKAKKAAKKTAKKAKKERKEQVKVKREK